MKKMSVFDLGGYSEEKLDKMESNFICFGDVGVECIWSWL